MERLANTENRLIDSVAGHIVERQALVERRKGMYCHREYGFMPNFSSNEPLEIALK